MREDEELRTRRPLRPRAEALVRVAERVSGVEARYDRAAVACLDDHINGQRPRSDEDARNLAVPFGALLGECIRAAYGAAWERVALLDPWGVRLDEQTVVLPIQKAHRHLVDGPEDSVRGRYVSIPSFLDE